MIFNLHLIRQGFQRYRCESGIAIFPSLIVSLKALKIGDLGQDWENESGAGSWSSG